MGDISKIEQGALARSSKVNEIIPVVNALSNMTVRLAEGEEEPGLNVADNNAELVVPVGTGGGGGGGAGLPEFPGEAPSVEIKAPLIWDAGNEEGRWLQGETLGGGDDTPYLDLFAYDPSPSIDTYSLNRYEVLDVIICKDGLPVEGKILFAETTT